MYHNFEGCPLIAVHCLGWKYCDLCIENQFPDANFVSGQILATPKSTQEGGDCKGILPKMPIDSGVGK